MSRRRNSPFLFMFTRIFSFSHDILDAQKMSSRVSRYLLKALVPLRGHRQEFCRFCTKLLSPYVGSVKSFLNFPFYSCHRTEKQTRRISFFMFFSCRTVRNKARRFSFLFVSLVDHLEPGKKNRLFSELLWFRGRMLSLWFFSGRWSIMFSTFRSALTSVRRRFCHQRDRLTC